MGGKSSPSNSQMVQFEMEQANEAKQKEADRQARLNVGKEAIDKLFGADNFGTDFYEKYNKASLDYNLPQLTTQYNKAKQDLTYDLARAGTLRSTAAGQAQGYLENENAVNEAAIRAKADTDTASLRQSIASQQQQAYNQLYATEDPDVAANTATHMVANAQIAQPNISPLGDLFKPLVIGATGAYQGYNDQTTLNNALKTSNPLSSGSGVTTY
ncbi:hypothetical protein QIH85_24090 [Bradyrhizobium japonicum]|uniref:hypothetical protein n=1 Tax=Bradyrhizobium japonicum TaxID=375 RepID=UPI0027153E23|nr:hypothetical protein [Bradyrhizobium japonicum]WLB24965.1 hypothetical protein QIH85_24090 [Bradyrhizobium japonicum]